MTSSSYGHEIVVSQQWDAAEVGGKYSLTFRSSFPTGLLKKVNQVSLQEYKLEGAGAKFAGTLAIRGMANGKVPVFSTIWSGKETTMHAALPMYLSSNKEPNPPTVYQNRVVGNMGGASVDYIDWTVHCSSSLHVYLSHLYLVLHLSCSPIKTAELVALTGTEVDEEPGKPMSSSHRTKSAGKSALKGSSKK